MQSKRNLTTDSEYHGYPIITDKKKGWAADVNILQRIEAQFEYAHYEKSKTLFPRMDIHFPKSMDVPADNEHIKRFLSAFMKNLKRQGLKPQYFAVREQSKYENRQHYHLGLLLDGQKTQNSTKHLKTAERLWDHELGLPPKPEGYGLVNLCDKDKKTGERVKPDIKLVPSGDNYELVRNNAFRRASYLAKVNTKGTPQGCREYFASRVPKEYTEKIRIFETIQKKMKKASGQA